MRKSRTNSEILRKSVRIKMPEAFFPVANNVKNPDRNLSGKSDEREQKEVK